MIEWKKKQQERLILTKLPNFDTIWQHVKQILKDDAPNDRDSDDEEKIQQIVDYLIPLITDLYLAQRESALSVGITGDKKRQHQDNEKRLQDLHTQVQLHNKALIYVVKDQPMLIERLFKFLLRNKCLMIVYIVSNLSSFCLFCFRLLKISQLRINLMLIYLMMR